MSRGFFVSSILLLLIGEVAARSEGAADGGVSRIDKRYIRNLQDDYIYANLITKIKNGNPQEAKEAEQDLKNYLAERKRRYEKARSMDLSVLGHLRQIVYQEPVLPMKSLIEPIRAASAGISLEQCLVVVQAVNRNDLSSNEYSSNETEQESNNNNTTIYDIISQLDIKSQLAKILLSECTIEPSKIAQKREKPVLSFEANVTPIYDTPSKKPKPNDELSILNAVEAVYSDGEDSPTVPCPVCNRSFSRNCSLALHMKSHEPLEDNSKRFQCQLCPRSYSQKSVLKKHQAECMSSHGLTMHGAAQSLQQVQHYDPPPTDDGMLRRFQCQLCPRSYSQKSVLKKHLAVHTGERERCNICGAGFSQRSSLVRHAKRIHGGLLNHALSGGSNHQPSHVTSSMAHSTPILTTALSGITHPTLGTPLIVGIPLNHLAAGKYAGTSLAAAAATGSIVVKSPAQLNNCVSRLNPSTAASLSSILAPMKVSIASTSTAPSQPPVSLPEPLPSTSAM